MTDIVRNHSFNTVSFARANKSKLTAFNANAVAEESMACDKANTFIDAFGRLVTRHDNSALAQAARVRAAGFMAALNDYQARA